jgi:glycosyltransferase involved in cell wall biosynthesis
VVGQQDGECMTLQSTPLDLGQVSIVIPTLNEAGNIAAMIARIDAVLYPSCIYEIIFIDDHSADKTIETILSFAAARDQAMGRVSAYSKQGAKGKAFSLIEGFSYAQFQNICMIDADLQYPPEAIPSMLTKLQTGYSVVVANRQKIENHIHRRALSYLGRKFYGRLLHGLDCDVQSGLKLFYKPILNQIALNTTAWTFDLTFLIQARSIGYKIGTVDIPFSKRSYGTFKVRVFHVGCEIILQSVKVKIASIRSTAYVISEKEFDDAARKSKVISTKEETA